MSKGRYIVFPFLPRTLGVCCIYILSFHHRLEDSCLLLDHPPSATLGAPSAGRYGDRLRRGMGLAAPFDSVGEPPEDRVNICFNLLDVQTTSV